MTDEKSFDRRQFVKGTVTVGATLSLAGCSLSDSDGDDGNSNTDGGSSNSDGGGSNGDESGPATDNSDGATSSSGGEISVGETVQGTLAEDAPTSPYQDRRAVPYELEVEEQQRVRISHESSEFNTYLILSDESEAVVRRNAGSISLNDNPPGTDSLLMPLLSPGETYTIWAGVDGFVSRAGDFTLSVGGTSALTGDARSITLGETVTTTADAGVPDPTSTSQLGYELKMPLQLELTEQTRVGIEGASGAVVTDGRVRPVTAADGEPSGDHRITVDGKNIVQNSSVATSRPDEGVVQFTAGYGEMTLSPGTYFIWADVGKDVTVREPRPVTDRVADAASLSPGETVTGELTREPPRDPQNHSYAVPYTFDGSAGQAIYADVDNTDITDTELLLTDTDGNTITLDGSQLSAQLPEDGTYVVWVRSRWNAGATVTGEFDISLTEATIPDEARTISIGDTVTAEITEDSPRDTVQNDLAVPFVVEGEGRNTAVLTQESDEFDPQVIVTDGIGEQNSRPPGLSAESANAAVVPVGPHEIDIVWAGSETGLETGTFTLSAEEWER
jgi:hypothetical protein